MQCMTQSGHCGWQEPLGYNSRNVLDMESNESPNNGGDQGLYFASDSEGWRLRDIDWPSVFAVQHYGTIIW